jgi:DNA-binding SARP family transcriptional activator
MLVLQEGRGTQHQWLLQEPIVLIGRSPDCQIVVDDRQASRHHARISCTEQGYLLEDLGSKNGTYLNGQRLTTPALLVDGDEIGIAFAARLRFVDAGATVPLTLDISRQPHIRIDPASRRVWVAGQELYPPLSPAQYRLLLLLYERAGQVVSREEVVHAVWGESAVEGVTEQAIDALTRRLRDRIAAADPDHQYVITVRGHGYRLQYAAP